MSGNPTIGTAIVGAQYGSEAKGHAVVALAAKKHFDFCVRTGGPNAGHSIWVDGRLWKMRQVPCGWVDPDTQLVIGPGAVIDADLLVKEVYALEDAGYTIADRLFVDARAGVIRPDQHFFEGGIEGQAHQHIGSTGEGVGITRIARICRGTLLPEIGPAYFSSVLRDSLAYETVSDVAAVLPATPSMYSGEVCLEGTQGYGLSLVHGKWPYVTSADTTAATFCADAGFPVTKLQHVIAVARCYPIRVAGNSGQLENETSWGELGLPEERTTVTQKVRRVGRWDDALVQEALHVNGATGLVLTGIDQMFPSCAGVTALGGLSDDALIWIDGVEERMGVRILYVGTSPNTGVYGEMFD